MVTVVITQKKHSRQYVTSTTFSCLLASPQSRLRSDADTTSLHGLLLVCVLHLSLIRCVLWCSDWQKTFLTS